MISSNKAFNIVLDIFTTFIYTMSKTITTGILTDGEIIVILNNEIEDYELKNEKLKTSNHLIREQITEQQKLRSS